MIQLFRLKFTGTVIIHGTYRLYIYPRFQKIVINLNLLVRATSLVHFVVSNLLRWCILVYVSGQNFADCWNCRLGLTLKTDSVTKWISVSLRPDQIIMSLLLPVFSWLDILFSHSHSRQFLLNPGEVGRIRVSKPETDPRDHFRKTKHTQFGLNSREHSTHYQLVKCFLLTWYHCPYIYFRIIMKYNKKI